MSFNFNNPYHQKDFLTFLRNDFLKDYFHQKVEKTDVINSFKSTYFRSVKKLGVCETLNSLIVLEIEHSSKNDARITITKELFKLLKQYDLNGETYKNALVIFTNPDTLQYRLSLLTTTYDENYKEKFSSPKRFSFLLGPNEKVKTPKDKLIKELDIKDFNDLVARFDVEVVRKEFFNKYLNLYIRLYQEIIKDAEFTKLLKSQKIDLVSFTKTLLGKIVFLYFIQKKGWLGVPKGGEYGKDGDQDFMRSIWNDFKYKGESLTSEKKGYFYNDYLEWLFYEGLNKDRRDNDDYFVNLQMKVPYLNGGLFKEDYRDWEKNIAKISNDIFSNDQETGILDIFDTYNFTIDEDDLYDREVAVDPEMLGRIFEKMISVDCDNIELIVEGYCEKSAKRGNQFITMDIENWNVGNNNKKLGAFYTPREIVHYMTKESLIAYLVNTLTVDKIGKVQIKYSSSILKNIGEKTLSSKQLLENKIRRLFEFKEHYLTKHDSDVVQEFEEVGEIIEEVIVNLQKVKILDPAIGSGAFPMGLLHEISSLKYYIFDVFYREFDMLENDEVKDFINENSSFSLYKIKKDIIQNNIYGVDISAGAIEIARLRFWLSLVIDEEEPEPLPNFEFKFVCANTLIPLEETNQQSLEKDLNIETLRKYMINYYNSQNNKDKSEGKIKIEKFLGIGNNQSQIGYIELKSARTKQLETYEPFNPHHSAEFFDSSLMMGNSKFDIVIGNPPYIQLQKDGSLNIRNLKYIVSDMWILKQNKYE